jgi:tripartite-type tricarboxylate transporter receptor subunit TctC
MPTRKVLLPRRRFLRLAGGAAALPVISHAALAQTYPTRPVRIVVGFAAGGATDIAARLIGQWLSERLGQQFIVENRPGASSNLAADAVIRASPDGYTLLLVSASNAINESLYDRLNFSLIRDLAPVAGISREANVLVANPSLPIKTVPEFIAYARANPGRINFASGGNGSNQHFVPGYEVIAFYGVGSPKNTPTAIVERLNGEINAALADRNIRHGSRPWVAYRL